MKQVAMVTGGAKRIGRSIVERLARDGYSVAIHCHNSGADARALAAQIEGQGGSAAVVSGDLADAAVAESLIGEAARALGPVTLLVNNASVFEPDELLTLTPEQWDRHFAINLRTPAFLARDFALQLPADRDGCIVNIIDQRVWKLTPQFFSYTLTKAALLTATTTMAQALAPRIRVNAIGPGPTLAGARQDEEDFAKQCAALPLRQASSPADIAEAVVFLANARGVTGQMIAVDSGQHLVWQTPDVVGIME
jgi:NAD(P)-dependent dehydrogenase (short-subunit alcohol dehydrogenase family)